VTEQPISRAIKLVQNTMGVRYLSLALREPTYQQKQ
jgi:hypothetical protein